MPTYYLDATRGNDSNAGTAEAQAWQTLARFRTAEQSGTFRPGDNILFKAGDVWDADQYRCMTIHTCNGAPGQPITVSRYGSGPDPAIRGHMHQHWHSPFNVDGVSHWEIERLELYDLLKGPAMRISNSSHLHVRHIHIHDVGNSTTDWAAGVILGNTTIDNGPHNCTIEHVRAERIRGEGFYIGNAKAADNTHDIAILNCEATDCFNEGIDVKSSARDVALSGCTVRRCGANEIADVSLGARSNGLLENTVIESTHPEQAVYLSQYTQPYPGGGCTIRGCTITGRNYGVRVHGSGHRIEDNLFVMAGSAHILLHEYRNAHDHTILKNDFSGQSQYALEWRGSHAQGYTIDENVYSASHPWLYDGQPRDLAYIRNLGHELSSVPPPHAGVTEERVIELFNQMFAGEYAAREAGTIARVIQALQGEFPV